MFELNWKENPDEWLSYSPVHLEGDKMETIMTPELIKEKMSVACTDYVTGLKKKLQEAGSS